MEELKFSTLPIRKDLIDSFEIKIYCEKFFEAPMNINTNIGTIEVYNSNNKITQCKIYNKNSISKILYIISSIYLKICL